MGNKVMDESNERTCDDQETYTKKNFKIGIIKFFLL